VLRLPRSRDSRSAVATATENRRYSLCIYTALRVSFRSHLGALSNQTKVKWEKLIPISCETSHSAFDKSCPSEVVFSWFPGSINQSTSQLSLTSFSLNPIRYAALACHLRGRCCPGVCLRPRRGPSVGCPSW
jgi:hypothetical protein